MSCDKNDFCHGYAGFNHLYGRIHFYRRTSTAEIIFIAGHTEEIILSQDNDTDWDIEYFATGWSIFNV